MTETEGATKEPSAKPEKIHIPLKEFETKTEIEKLFLITDRLKAIGLTPSELLYCGAEGTTLLTDSGLEDRSTTFAASYKKVLEAAKEIDTHGETDDAGYPFLYAFKPEVTLPAVIAYDKSQLIPQNPEEDSDWDRLEEWVHKTGGSVNVAISAIIFFEK